MIEVVVPEEAPTLVPAIVVEWGDPQLAQVMLGVCNQLYPLSSSEAHLKRIRSVPFSSQNLTNASPCTFSCDVSSSFSSLPQIFQSDKNKVCNKRRMQLLLEVGSSLEDDLQRLVLNWRCREHRELHYYCGGCTSGRMSSADDSFGKRTADYSEKKRQKKEVKEDLVSVSTNNDGITSNATDNIENTKSIEDQDCCDEFCSTHIHKLHRVLLQENKYALRYERFSKEVAEHCRKKSIFHGWDTTVQDTRSPWMFQLILVPDRSPRRNPDMWTKWNAVWPLAVPKPSPPELPSASFIETSTEVMVNTVLPIAKRLLQFSTLPGFTKEESRTADEDCTQTTVITNVKKATPPFFFSRILGTAAAVVDPTTMKILVTSEEFAGLQNNCIAACAPYGIAAVQNYPEIVGREKKEFDNLSSYSPFLLDHPVTFVLKQLSIQQGKAKEKHHEKKAELHPLLQEESASIVNGSSTNDTFKKGPHLANNLDVYVTHEPCVMCAMALVHSRVRRVFFCFKNTCHGGIGSRYAIHSMPSLNHHYQGYHCIKAAEIFLAENDVSDGEDPLIGTKNNNK